MSYRGGGGGYSRGGGYRGSRGESSWRGSRGSFSSSRGGGGGRYFESSPPSNYEQRSRSYLQGGSNERYSNRGRSDDGYRPSYRSQESQDYGGRDFGGMRGMSPEPPRKRMRTDSSYGASSRRSHERSFGSTGEDYGRSYYISDKGSGGGYSGNKSSYRDIRESRSNEYSFRKPGISTRAPRGSFRGRSFSSTRGRGRGYSRSSLSSSGFISRKRALTDTYSLRTRYVSSKSPEYLRRLKLYRQKRFKSAEGDDRKSDDEEDDEDLDDEKEEEGEVDDISSQDGNEEKEEGEVEGDHKEEEEDEEEEEEEEVEEEGDEGDVKEKAAKKVEKKVVKKVEKKSPIKKSKPDASESKTNQESKIDSGGEEDQTSNLKNFLGQPYIRLKCPHCFFTCVTFKEYAHHLGLKKHQIAMRNLSSKLRQTLARMRVEQRQKQLSLDADCKAQGNMNLRTFFCPICKLNYRTLKSHHHATVSHKKMKEFLLPFCKICRTSFKSPMLYEAHICDLNHIRRKARIERIKATMRDEEEDEIGSVNDLDTSSFMVLDAVGSGDESEAEKSEGNEEVEEKTEQVKLKDDEEVEKKQVQKKKTEVKIGAEYCKLVEVYYCDLCKTYLPRLDDKKKALTIHCRSRNHLQRWTRDQKIKRSKTVRLNKERSLKSEKKEEEDKEKKKGEEEEGKSKPKIVKEDTESSQEQEKTTSENSKKHSGDLDESMEIDDKIWSDMDKDLAEILTEEGNKSSDEDEDSRPDGGRYDRFKHSDKNNDKSGEPSEVKQEDAAPVKASIKSNTTHQPNGSVSQSEKVKIEDKISADE